PTTPKGGPIPTTLALADTPAKIYQPKPGRRFDPNFNLDTETFEKEVVFQVVTELKKDAFGAVELTANVRYQACDSKQCLPPKKKTAAFTLTADASAPAPAGFVLQSGYTDITAAAPQAPPKSSESIATFLLTAFGFGLVTIFTPCVFPM